MSRSAWRYEIGKKLYRILFSIAPITKIPIVGKWFNRNFMEEGDLAYYIPVNAAIEETENIVLPSEIIRNLIKTASHRFIMYRCICRDAEGCINYPADLGCIFLGEATKTISPQLGEMASVDEALEHLEKCESAGLVHMIGRLKFDAILLNAKPSNKLLSICNCCECCCIFRLIPDLYEPTANVIQRLEGVNVHVKEEDCIGCGLCRDVCFVNAISVINEKAHISDLCKGCGRCVRTCPNNAITLSIEKSDLLESTIKRVSDIVVI